MTNNQKTVGKSTSRDTRRPFMVTWRGRDADGAQCVIASTARKAIEACCPDDHIVVGPMKFEFIKEATVYVHKDVELEHLENEDPTDTRGVILVGAEETVIVRAK